MNISGQIGRLTRKPNLRSTTNGTIVASFTLAVDRQGTYGAKKKVDFIDCVIWRNPAEWLAETCQQGTLVSIEGFISTRTYKNRLQQTIKVTEIVVREFNVLKNRRKKEEQPVGNDEELPVSESIVPGEVEQLGISDNDYYERIQDDDLPF